MKKRGWSWRMMNGTIVSRIGEGGLSEDRAFVLDLKDFKVEHRE